MTQVAHCRFVRVDQFGQARIGETKALELAHARRIERGQTLLLHFLLGQHDVFESCEEPRIDAAQIVHFFQRQDLHGMHRPDGTRDPDAVRAVRA